MIITLKGANFSGNYIGTLTTYIISVSGAGLTHSIPSTIEREGATLTNQIITINDGYELNGDVVVTMGGTTLSGVATVDGNTITINIGSVTGNVSISVPTKSTSGEDEEDNPSGDTSSISFTNDEFEIGALDGSGNPVDLTTRYRTKNIKKFSQAVLLTGKVLSGETSPSHVRVAQYSDNGTFVSMGQFADTATIPANTGFRLILERSAGGNITRGDINLTVPTGATRLYVNTLKTDKAISSVTTPREIIQGSTFTDGLYYYGTVGETVGTVTSSSKMAAYEGYLNVNAGETVTVNVYTSATLGCVFTDDTDTVILLGENSTFSGRNYQPLDFFTYEVQ